MARIFISYRRDDDPNGAARIRDALAAKFGRQAVFMDVDDLLAGLRFDEELAKALSQCDVFLAVIGPRWLELLRAKAASGERDYVREEIAAALQRRIVVIPVRIGREGQLPALPRAEDLPAEIRDLVHYQKHDVGYERFGRDAEELVEAITAVRKRQRPAAPPVASRVPWGWVGASIAATLVAGYVGAYYAGVPVPWPGAPPAVGRAEPAKPDTTRTDTAVGLPSSARPTEEARARKQAEEIERLRVAAAKAEDDRRRAEAAAAIQPGRVFRDCTDGCPEMVVVPAGEFLMGSPDNEPGRSSDEGPTHRVTIRQPFAVGRYEVTFAEWDACVAERGCTHKPGDQGWGRGKRPVIYVSWEDARQYVAWLSRKTRQSYRLLTESEWEYAARAGTATPFSTGATITPEQANFDGNYTYNGSAKGQYRQRTMDVGSFKPNAFGLYDMHGNVWEWVEDCYVDSYNAAPTDGGAAPEKPGCSRVLRGGSWINYPVILRSARRNYDQPDFRNLNIGFRLARTLSHTP